MARQAREGAARAQRQAAQKAASAEARKHGNSLTRRLESLKTQIANLRRKMLRTRNRGALDEMHKQKNALENALNTAKRATRGRSLSIMPSPLSVITDLLDAMMEAAETERDIGDVMKQRAEQTAPIIMPGMYNPYHRDFGMPPNTI